MLKELLKFSLGLVAGHFTALLLLDLFLAPDPVQYQASHKSKCKSVEETLRALEYEPEAWRSYYSAHEKIIRHCQASAKWNSGN